MAIDSNIQKATGLPVLGLISIAAGIALYFYLETKFPTIHKLVRGK